MKRSSNKFLHRVRIHGGEFDASARAMHRDGMTNSFQAAVETVSIATIERKQMSTKTTFKRIALVTVAALGFGVLSTVSSSAAVNSDSLTITNTAGTATTSFAVSIGDTVTATTSAVATMSFLPGTAAVDSVTVTASLVSGPTGNTALPYISISDTTSAEVRNSTGVTQISFGANNTVSPNVAAAVVGLADATISTAALNVYLGTTKTAGPTVAGTYVVRLTPATFSGAALAGSTVATLTIVVAAADLSASAALSTSIICQGSYAGCSTEIADSATVAGTKSTTSTAGILPQATIFVTQANAAGTANESMTVIVSGAGLVSSTAAVSTNRALAGRAITAKNGHYINVFSDGSSGAATITITGGTSLAVLGVEKITWYGAVATLTPTVRTAVVSSLGGNSSGTSALLVVAKDSNGTVIPTGTLYAESSAQTSIPDATCAWSATYSAHACTLAPVASKTGSVSFTMRDAVRATTVAATTISAAAAVSVTLGEAPAKVAMSFDKSVYGQGEAAKLSLTLTDKNGKPVANGIYANILDADMIESTYALTGLTDTHTVTAATSTGTMVLSVNMPIAEVDVAVTGTTGLGFATVADQAVAVKAGVVSVKSNSSSAATDAANEATDAANAATDAANAAAEAADAATAAAQDAADAVAALSTEVAGLIAALKAQITSLTNLVIKIQKKVKA